VSYLIVDAADDAILAECEWPQDVVSILKQLQEEDPDRQVLVGWFGEHQGELVGTQAFATARSLSVEEAFALYARPKRA
jgi:hypothetical protein